MQHSWRILLGALLVCAALIPVEAECPSTPCLNGSTCDDSGICICSAGWNGVSCDECATGYGGANCSLATVFVESSIAVNDCDPAECCCPALLQVKALSGNFIFLTGEARGPLCGPTDRLMLNTTAYVSPLTAVYPASAAFSTGAGVLTISMDVPNGNLDVVINSGSTVCPSFSHFINYCVSAPCLNHATCTTTLSSYTCECPAAWTGPNCEVPIAPLSDACVSNPCHRDAECLPGATAGTFSCICDAQLTGPTCQIPITASSLCASSPCSNGGACTLDASRPTGFACECNELWAGATCDTPLASNICELYEPCLFNGTCIVQDTDVYTCDCGTQAIGTNCETSLHPCLTTPCLNGGQCEAATGQCECLSGFVGTLCETFLSECASSPCQNNGECVGADIGLCHCPDNVFGTYCETVIDQSVCDSSPCLNNAVCVSGLESFPSATCYCPFGFTGDLCDLAVLANVTGAATFTLSFEGVDVNTMDPREEQLFKDQIAIEASREISPAITSDNLVFLSLQNQASNVQDIECVAVDNGGFYDATLTNSVGDVLRSRTIADDYQLQLGDATLVYVLVPQVPLPSAQPTTFIPEPTGAGVQFDPVTGEFIGPRVQFTLAAATIDQDFATGSQQDTLRLEIADAVNNPPNIEFYNINLDVIAPGSVIVQYHIIDAAGNALNEQTILAASGMDSLVGDFEVVSLTLVTTPGLSVPQSTPLPSPSNGSDSKGIVAGVCVGLVLAIVIVCALWVRHLRRQHRRYRPATAFIRDSSNFRDQDTFQGMGNDRMKAGAASSLRRSSDAHSLMTEEALRQNMHETSTDRRRGSGGSGRIGGGRRPSFDLEQFALRPMRLVEMPEEDETSHSQSVLEVPSSLDPADKQRILTDNLLREISDASVEF